MKLGGGHFLIKGLRRLISTSMKSLGHAQRSRSLANFAFCGKMLCKLQVVTFRAGNA
jgi:hypothetical protein